MKKFTIIRDLDYVQGYLRYGHLELTVEAETEEDALEKVKDYREYDYQVIVDDYSVDDYGDAGEPYIFKE
jgi:hypothetical protein